MSYYYALKAITISQIWWLPLYLGARPLKREANDYGGGEEGETLQGDRPQTSIRGDLWLTSWWCNGEGNDLHHCLDPGSFVIIQ